jgi:hypothetical protein
MTQLTTNLYFQSRPVSVPRKALMLACGLFEANPAWLATGRAVQSAVEPAVFNLFADAIRGTAPELTRQNAPGLKLLCDEFQFQDLGAKVDEFLSQYAVLVHPYSNVRVLIPRANLLQKCGRFRGEPGPTQPYAVQAAVRPQVFQLFCNAIEGADVEVLLDNADQFRLLCDEFDFTDLRVKVDAVLNEWVIILWMGGRYPVPRECAAQRCLLFREPHPTPYAFPWAVSPEIFEAFLQAIQGTDPQISHANAPMLKLLCDHVQFTELGTRVQEFLDSRASLVHQGEIVKVARANLLEKCRLFRDGGFPATEYYNVRSPVAVEVFRAFAGTIDGIDLELTNENVIDIQVLSEEFGYEELAARVPEFLAQHSSARDYYQRTVVPLRAQLAEIAALKETVQALEARVLELEQGNQSLDARLTDLDHFGEYGY